MSTLTLSLSDKEASVLHQLATMQDMPQSAVMRQALRLYQHVVEKQRAGHELAFTKNGEVVRQVVVGLPLPE